MMMTEIDAVFNDFRKDEKDDKGLEWHKKC